MKVAIVVQGRFYAFDLARALAARGHEVTLLTNYPRWATRRFDLLGVAVWTFPTHGLLARAAGAVPGLARRLEPALHRLFGRWAARRLLGGRWDAVHCWSGVSEELLTRRAGGHARTLLMRGSSHIATQRRLLADESMRVASVLDCPSDWMVAREGREYRLADRVVVLSSFAARTFADQGVPAGRIGVLRLGVDVRAFKGDAESVRRRADRIRSGEPLTVLNVGTVSFRKGFRDLATVVQSVEPGRFRFRLVGAVLPEVRTLLASLGSRVEVVGKVPQSELPARYGQGDLFLFPTIEDGFPVVLAQAQAAGLPIITTPNGAGHDIVRSEADGWVVPIRDPDAIRRRLEWCDQDRGTLADMAWRLGTDTYAATRDWHDVAADFETLCATGGVQEAEASPTDGR